MAQNRGRPLPPDRAPRRGSDESADRRVDSRPAGQRRLDPGYRAAGRRHLSQRKTVGPSKDGCEVEVGRKILLLRQFECQKSGPRVGEPRVWPALGHFAFDRFFRTHLAGDKKETGRLRGGWHDKEPGKAFFGKPSIIIATGIECSERIATDTGRGEPILSVKHHVVIVGGGFGGLYFARHCEAAAQVTLIDRRNFHLFQPLLYQVATGGLSPANIAAPLRAVLARHSHSAVLMAEVCGFDLAGRRVLFSDDSITYDSLIVAAGSETSYFGHENWDAIAPGLKTIEEATDIRRRVLTAFETAERQRDAVHVRQQLTFVIIGGGPTGVEMAGAVAEMARHTLRGEFRGINPSDARIYLIEGSERVERLSAKGFRPGQAQLEQLGVTVRLNTLVTDVRSNGVTIRRDEHSEEIVAATSIWAAGVRASSLGKVLADAAGLEPDRQGRVPVAPDLSLPTHPEVFVIGDMALVRPFPDAAPLPGLRRWRCKRDTTWQNSSVTACAGALCDRFDIATAATWPRSVAPGPWRWLVPSSSPACWPG